MQSASLKSRKARGIDQYFERLREPADIAREPHLPNPAGDNNPHDANNPQVDGPLARDTVPIMDITAELRRSIRTLSTDDLKECLRIVGAELGTRETTNRAPAEPRPVTAKELDGVPPALRVKPHKKYRFAPEELVNPERVKSEQSISSARKRKLRDGVKLTEEEDERGRMAAAFVKQAGRRQSEMSAPKVG